MGFGRASADGAPYFHSHDEGIIEICVEIVKNDMPEARMELDFIGSFFTNDIPVAQCAPVICPPWPVHF